MLRNCIKKTKRVDDVVMIAARQSSGGRGRRTTSGKSSTVSVQCVYLLGIETKTRHAQQGADGESCTARMAAGGATLKLLLCPVSVVPVPPSSPSVGHGRFQVRFTALSDVSHALRAPKSTRERALAALKLHPGTGSLRAAIGQKLHLIRADCL